MARLTHDQELVERLKQQYARYVEDWWKEHKDDMWSDEDDPYHDWNEQYDEQGRLLRLNLWGVQLTQLPSELWQCTYLQHLDLGLNQLSSLPAELGQLVNLRGLLLTDNPGLQMPPSEIIRQGTRAIQAYLRAL